MHQQKILVLGGGTAGWMAANLIANAFDSKRVKVCVLESPDIGIVGVGEGSTPQLKALFEKLGIAESDWMPKANATYKNGIRFKGWSSRPNCEEYFHPFPAKTDRDTAQAFVYNSYLRRQNIDVDVHPSKYFLPSFLAHQSLGPHPDESFPFPVSYGYHFDAYLVGEVLKEHAFKLGVEHIQATVSRVNQSTNGDINSLVTDQGSIVEADFFIDCSGFAGLLIGKTLNVDFDSFSENLFNDSAVVMPSEHERDETGCVKQIESQTTATALSNGWAWEIPLSNRIGNGYVYSGGHISDDKAETELRTKLGLLESDVRARHLKMRVGQRKEHWSRNCLAVGLSQGFLEPLEATALHLAQVTIETFIQYFAKGNTSSREKAEFNKAIYSRFEGIRDYIVCHYKVNSRPDTDYWRECTENIRLSDSLRSLLAVWNAGEDISVEIERQGIAQYYPTLSWHCLLSGYGVFDFPSRLLSDDRAQRFAIDDIVDFNRRCALNFQPQVAQLNF